MVWHTSYKPQAAKSRWGTEKEDLGKKKVGREQGLLFLFPFLFLPLCVNLSVCPSFCLSCIFLSTSPAHYFPCIPKFTSGLFLIRLLFSIMRLLCICNTGFCLFFVFLPQLNLKCKSNKEEILKCCGFHISSIVRATQWEDTRWEHPCYHIPYNAQVKSC